MVTVDEGEKTQKVSCGSERKLPTSLWCVVREGVVNIAFRKQRCVESVKVIFSEWKVLPKSARKVGL